ncbi:MAG: ABC transporter substrate-binding protein [Coriobacteriales bacterium]|nr:ABC transporter substrate-binding protein [Coriobacteriales bacterium]
MDTAKLTRRSFVGAAAATTVGMLAMRINTPAPAAAEEKKTLKITDMRGREVEIPEKPERIIAIGCAQRFACYLGAAGKLIGVEESDKNDAVACTYRHVYHDLFENLPITGDGGSNGALVNEEAILVADPQLILCDSIDVDSCNALQERTGIPVVALDQPESVFDEFYYQNMMVAGEALGKQDRAKEIVDFIKGIEKDIADRVKDADKSITAYACGISYRGGHGFDGTEAKFPPFMACGVTNVADGKDLDGPYTIDVEAVIEAQPDFIFIEAGNLDLVKEDYEKSPAVYEALDAVMNKNTYTIISHRYYSTNVELALANCYQVACVLFPEEFKDIDSIEKLDEICKFLLDSESCTFFKDHKMSEDLAEKGYEYKQVDITKL